MEVRCQGDFTTDNTGILLSWDLLTAAGSALPGETYDSSAGSTIVDAETIGFRVASDDAAQDLEVLFFRQPRSRRQPTSGGRGVAIQRQRHDRPVRSLCRGRNGRAGASWLALLGLGLIRRCGSAGDAASAELSLFVTRTRPFLIP